MEHLHSTLRLLALIDSIDQCAASHQVGQSLGWPLHCLKYLKNTLWLFAVFAGTDQGTVGDYVGHKALPLHVPECLQGPFQLRPFLACTDKGVVRDYVGNHTLPLHYLKDL